MAGKKKPVDVEAYYAAMLASKIAAGLRKDQAEEVVARQRAEDEANKFVPEAEDAQPEG